MKTVTEQMAEAGTGCVENPHGVGKFYDDRGNELTREEAQDRFNDGKLIEVPNAGAGSYSRVFKALGYEAVETVEHGSSAGDWTFAVKDGDCWYLAFQNNRYPYHGFSYSRHEWPHDSFEDACEFAFQD